MKIINLEINELTEKVIIKNAALSINSTHRYKINNQFRDGLDWSSTTLLDPFGEISSITINELLIEKKWSTIDLLKIDIEGAEAEIFRSNVDFLEKTRIIALEVHEEFISHIEIESILKKFGFIVFYSGELTIGINKYLLA